MKVLQMVTIVIYFILYMQSPCIVVLLISTSSRDQKKNRNVYIRKKFIIHKTELKRKVFIGPNIR